MLRRVTPRPAAHHLLRLLGRRLPRTRGRLTVDGIGESVVIRRDRWGIPHIETASDHDAWFGLGFCHAQDRGFQLETLLRAGRGTVAAREQPPGWFEVPWPEEAASVLARVVERLERTHGSDPAGWAWGSLRPLTLRHPLGSRRHLDRILNVGPVPLGGDAYTPAQASVHPLDPLANPGAIANTRAAIDLGDIEANRFVLAGGQSGNPLSRHYRDLFDLWRRGEDVPIAWSATSVEKATVATLRLDPSRTPPANPMSNRWPGSD